MNSTQRARRVSPTKAELCLALLGARRLARLVAAAALIGIASSALLTSGASAATTTPRLSTRPAAQLAVRNHLVVHRLNAIRSSFGLNQGQTTTAYNSEVTRSVLSNEDPPFAPATGGIVEEDSLWGIVPTSAATTTSPLVIVNGWVYHDGWEGSTRSTWNADCTSAHATGCNGHRRNVLSTPPVAGARLYIDVTTRNVKFNGAPALAVAALFVWKMPVAAA